MTQPFFGAFSGAMVAPFNGAAGGGDWPLVLDFVNGSYASATTTYALADVWVSDVDWGSGGDLARVVPGSGIVCDQSGDYQSYRFNDQFIGLAQAGPIVVYDFNINSIDADGSGVAVTAYEAVNYTYERCKVYNNGDEVALDWTDNTQSPSIVTSLVTNGDHKLAVLFSSSKIAVSLDGGTVTELATTGAVTPMIFDRVAVEIRNSNPGHSVTLRSAQFRDPAEGEGALATLSAL